MKKGLNAGEVLARVEMYIAAIEAGWYENNRNGVAVDDVYEELSIFDWWVDRLSLAKLKDMRLFLKEAIKLGYAGYVCFKVGATGCANGMWAYKQESVDGYSPRFSEVLYKTFTPAYNYWRVGDNNGNWFPSGDGNGAFDSINTVRKLEALVESVNLMVKGRGRK